MIVTTFMSDEDKEAVAYAKRIGFVFPRYRCSSTDHKGEPYVREDYFTPAQFRAITAESFPECATVTNCQRLIGIWNRAGVGRYEFLF
jgi:hypothetical protein